jgi:hypothetical protein
MCKERRDLASPPGREEQGYLEGRTSSKVIWKGEPRKDLDRELPHGQIANAVSVLKHQKR